MADADDLQKNLTDDSVEDIEAEELDLEEIEDLEEEDEDEEEQKTEEEILEELPDDQKVEEIINESRQLVEDPPPNSSSSLSQYLHELQRYQVLRGDQEKQLAVLAQAGNQKAKQALVNHNLRFAITVAQRYSNQSVQLEDLIQQGNIGLMKAVERFDPSRGVKFISYAVYWINQSIRSWLASQQRTVRLPVNRATQLSRIKKYISKHRRETGEEPSADQIAEATEVPEPMVRTLKKISRPDLSLESPGPGGGNDEGDGVPLGERIGDEEEDLDERLERWCRDRNIKEALSNLRERDEQVVRLFYGLDGGREHTLQEIGEILGVTRERVRQIRDRALKELRNHGRAHTLEDYAGQKFPQN